MSVKDILTNNVFGKSLQDGTCFLNKVDAYFKTTKAGIWNLGFLNPKDYMERDLLTILKDSGEYDEPQFNDIKNEIIKSITDERSNFCTKKQEIKCPEGQTLDPKTGICGGGGKPPVPGPSKWRVCADPYSKGCKETDPNGPLHKVQECIGVKSDGLFGDITEAALLSKTQSKSFIAKDVDKICSSSGGGGQQEPSVTEPQSTEVSNDEEF
jgi:hypothetical protein